MSQIQTPVVELNSKGNPIICGKPCEVYSRIVGYFRPIDNWNEGKKAEFRDRKNYTPFK